MKSVKKFQEENALDPDGLAGEATRMMIFGQMPEYKTPHIS
jgi:murein L,D-transpeptidase YcbB/YkuD